jgi:hypothetical protein
MLMVVLGAGASYDSIHGGDLPDRPDMYQRPPLAAELFTNRPNFGAVMMNLPTARPLIARLRQAVDTGRDVEEALEEVQTLADKGHPQLFRQLMAVKFYLRDIIRDCSNEWVGSAYGLTNYTRLLDKIELWRRPANERVLLVTFNYDHILEGACGEVLDMHVSEMPHYVFRGDYRLIHLHGSVRWGRMTTLAEEGTPGHSGPTFRALPRDLIALAHEVEMTDEFFLGPPGEVEGYAVAPALAIPFRSKAAFECPPEHLQAMRDWLPSVDRCLVIGWRAQEMHFLQMWREVVNPELEGLVVSQNQDSAEAVVAFLHENLGSGKLFASAARGFSALAREDEILLSVFEKRIKS